MSHHFVTPPSDRAADLGFVRQKHMVCWFHPKELVRIGTKALLATIFGAYADKRELQAVLATHELYDQYHLQEDIWIDYVADLGDGWNPTYTIGWLLAQQSLTLDQNHHAIKTPRGQILVMGGDAVYPMASREAYRDHMVGPYRSALPCVLESKPPHLFAIPGNHDWYDGLTSFCRLFSQERWIGGWQTRQSRSYFAIRLPHNWWLWGVDIQLETDIDKPQLDYFEKIATQYMEPGDQVILCTVIPSWLEAGKETDAGASGEGVGPQHNLTFLVEEYIHKYGGYVPLTIAGNLHHYCHFQDTSGRRHKITAGGGGAFLHGTHWLPKTLKLTEDGATTTYSRGESFPDTNTSRVLALGNVLFPFKNPWMVSFLGSLYLLYAWILQSASKRNFETFMDAIQNTSFTLQGVGYVLGQLYLVIAHSPVTFILFLFLLFAGYGFCDPPPGKHRWVQGTKQVIIGGGHGLLHLSLLLSLMQGKASKLNS